MPLAERAAKTASLGQIRIERRDRLPLEELPHCAP
jgi:hypothetical protein